MKKLFALILSLALSLSMIACAQQEEPTSAPQTEPPVTQLPSGDQVGELCPATDLPIIDGSGETGQFIDPTETGMITVINFWGTWCGPCVSELPHLEELAANYADSVCVVAVHSTQDYRKAPGFIKSNYPDSQMIFSWETTEDYNGAYYLATGGEGYYPYTVVLDAQGVIVEKKVGAMSYAEMEAMVLNAGAQPAQKPAEAATASIEDAYSQSFTDSYDRLCCYHIPRVALPDDLAANANQTIYDQLYPMVKEAEDYAGKEWEYIQQMHYEAWQTGEIISVAVQVRQPFNDALNYYIYNISAATGQLLTDEQLYSALGISNAGEKLTGCLNAYWETPNTDMPEDMIASLKNDTFSQAFTDEAMPFAGPDGQLCFAVKIAAPAGAGFFWAMIDPAGQLFYANCDIH